MGKTKLDETYIFKISIKMRFLSCNYWYQNFVFRVSVTIEPGPSLPFVTKNRLTLKLRATLNTKTIRIYSVLNLKKQVFSTENKEQY